MKTTPLTSRHEALDAKMVEFAGFNMPVYYSGIKEEHHAVRNKIGMFDVSHMGEFKVKGPHAAKLLQYVTSNDITKLYPGRAQYNCLPNEQGGIIDDLIVYMVEEEEYMMVVNAANQEIDWTWVQHQNQHFNAKLEDVSDQTALIAVQGPEAKKMLQKHTDVDLGALKFYTFTKGTIAGANDVILSSTGYTGEDGMEFYCNAEDATTLWDTFMQEGEAYGIKPAGLGARDTLRLEAGLALYGNDIDTTTSPLEARLSWITKLDTDFIGKDVLAKQKEEGIKRKLVGIELMGKGIARHGHEILDENEEKLGTVTSGTQSPTLGKSIAMGYVKKPHSKPDTSIKIKIRNKTVDAKVIKLPFYKRQ